MRIKFKYPIITLGLAILTNTNTFAGLNTKPNIVYILADDLGWADLQAPANTAYGHGSDFYKTPNITALAQQGISFNNAYSAGANCAPTRGALYSGQYATGPANGIYTVGSINRGGNSTLLIGPAGTSSDDIVSSTITMPETLQAAGYTTAHLGKYHVGGREAGGASLPKNNGFDYNFGGNTNGNPGSNGYWASAYGRFNSHIGPELDYYASPGEYLTDAMTDAALDFMQNYHTNTVGPDADGGGGPRPRGASQSPESIAPFYVNFSHYAVHTPITNQAKPDYIAEFDALKTTSPSQIGHDNTHYAAMLKSLDESVGRIMDYLNTTEDPRNPGHMLAENTLVIFNSDNGGHIGPTTNTPLKGRKGMMTEGGIRVPLIAWMPGSINPGQINDTPVNTVDFYRTFTDIGQGTLPDQNLQYTDGKSLKELFTNENAILDRDSLFWHFPGYLDSRAKPTSVIRKGNYKLLYFYEDEHYELYDVVNDISETTDLLDDNQSIALDLATTLRQWLVDQNAPLPTYRAGGQTVPLPSLVNLPEPASLSLFLLGLSYVTTKRRRK